MSTDPEIDDVMALVANRIDLLSLLEGTRLRKREIVDELDHSRSTVNRAITTLADAGLVDDAPRGCQTTFVGSLMADQYREYEDTVSDIVRARDVLTPLPAVADLPPTVLTGAEIVTPEGPRPYHAVEEVLQRPGADGRLRVYVPAFSNPRSFELAKRLVRTFPVEIVFTDELLAELNPDFTDEVEALLELERFAGYRTADGPRYTLAIADSESGSEGVIVTHTEERNLGGVIVTSDADALDWMERRYSEIRAASEPLNSIGGTDSDRA
jgi:predicted transcriptional regulator